MGKSDKPKGRTTAYAFFVQTCRDEHKKKHPGEVVVFAEFSKKCAEKWKKMNVKEKKRFDDMAQKDKKRFENEMANYTPSGDDKSRKRKKKDPNAPKRALSAFFFFCNEKRAEVKASLGSSSVGDIAKELGKRWEKVGDRSKYEEMAKKDKARYEKEMKSYKAGGSPSSPVKSKKAKQKPVEEEEEEDEEEEEEEEEEEDDEEEDDDEEDE